MQIQQTKHEDISKPASPAGHDLEAEEGEIAEQAGAVAEQMQDQDVQALLAAMEHDMRLRKRAECVYAAMAIAAGLLWFFALCTGRLSRGNFLLIADLALFIPPVVVRMLRPRLKSKTARRITQLDDVRYVGLLVDIWNGNAALKYDPQTRDAAQEALTRLLPCLRAEDAGLLNETHRAQLRNVLVPSYNRSGGKSTPRGFQLAVIQAFDQIGDWKSVSSVEQLTREDDSRVREAARRCAAHLRQLEQHGIAGEVLLRASAAPMETKPETLLRPAAGTGTGEDPEQLVRAASGAETERDSYGSE